jgi:hypothetical protein
VGYFALGLKYVRVFAGSRSMQSFILKGPS